VLTLILKYGSILEKPRAFLVRRGMFFKDLFACSLCLGFWGGAAISGSLFFIEWNDFYYFLPLVSAFCSLTCDSLVRLMQTCEIYLEKK